METKIESKENEVEINNQYFNIYRQKTVNVYNVENFKKLNFKKFEILIGPDELTEYYYDNQDLENYQEPVEEEDYDKFDLIDQDKIDLLDFMELNELKNLISNIEYSDNFYCKIEDIVRDYLEENLYYTDDVYFSLGNFSFSYVIDGVETEVED